MVFRETVVALHASAEALATNDFSPEDARFGHALATLPVGRWTPMLVRDAWELLLPYQAALGIHGIDFEAIPEPSNYSDKHIVVDSAKGPHRTTRGREELREAIHLTKESHSAAMWLDGDTVIIDSAKDAQIIAAVKALPGAVWQQRPPLWQVPVPSLLAAKRIVEIATDFEMAVSEDFGPIVLGLGSSSPANDVAVGVWLDEETGNILVRTGFVDGAHSAVQKLDGATYRNQTDCWSLLMTLENWDRLQILAKKYDWPVDDRIGRAIEERFAEAVRAYQEAIALEPSGRITEIPGMRDVPGKPLDSAQWAGIEYIVEHESGVLVADEPGVAKTAQMMSAMAYLGRRKMIWVCPSVAKKKMVGEAMERFPAWDPRIIDGRGDKNAEKVMSSFDPDGESLIILNYEILTAHVDRLIEWAPDAVVFDEGHRLKEKTTSWTKAAKTLSDDVRAREGTVAVLSGTPMPSGPWELISPLEILGRLDEIGGWKHFAQHFCGARQQSVRGRRVWVLDKRQNLGELNTVLRRTCMLRRRLEDVVPDLECLPPEIISVDLDPAKMVEYREAERDLAEYMAKRAAEIARSMGADPHSAAVRARLKVRMAEEAIELLVLRQLIGSAKVPGTVEWVKTWLDENASGAMAELDGEVNAGPGKIVIFGWFNEVVNRLHEELGGLAIKGSDSRAARDRAREAFQADPNQRILVASIGAASEAVEFTAAHTCVTVEYDWVPKTHKQAVGRLYRRGQTKPVRPIYVHADGTTDDVQRHVLDEKGFAEAQAIDGVVDPSSLDAALDVEAMVFNSLIDKGTQGGSG